MFVYGGGYFQNIGQLVDQYFNTYVRRIGFDDPFFTEFCNGTTATCPGMSQWGTVPLANQGLSPLQILRRYYPNDIELIQTNNVGGVAASYPGFPLRLGSSGEPVRRMQRMLNRIRVNFPAIPRIDNPKELYCEGSFLVGKTERLPNKAAKGFKALHNTFTLEIPKHRTKLF